MMIWNGLSSLRQPLKTSEWPKEDEKTKTAKATTMAILLLFNGIVRLHLEESFQEDRFAGICEDFWCLSGSPTISLL
jgi:hypothetical protein